jgi:hypothetical protein
LFWRVKEELTGLSLDKDNLIETMVGVTITIDADAFATAMRQKFECCEKCIRIDIGYTKKRQIIKTFLALTVIFLFQ